MAWTARLVLLAPQEPWAHPGRTALRVNAGVLVTLAGKARLVQTACRAIVGFPVPKGTSVLMVRAARMGVTARKEPRVPQAFQVRVVLEDRKVQRATRVFPGPKETQDRTVRTVGTGVTVKSERQVPRALQE